VEARPAHLSCRSTGGGKQVQPPATIPRSTGSHGQCLCSLLHSSCKRSRWLSDREARAVHGVPGAAHPHPK
jgi:hypothetical protein